MGKPVNYAALRELAKGIDPCPFSGGRNLVLVPRTCDRGDEYDPADYAYPRIACDCGAEMGGDNWGEPITAVVKWNTRADQKATAA
jgi:hypothetical protein